MRSSCSATLVLVPVLASALAAPTAVCAPAVAAQAVPQGWGARKARASGGADASRTERFGDVAHVFSTYQQQVWESDEILGRGVNSIQLVWNAGRWWITAIAWDEEVGAGPLPERYLSGGH